MPRDRNAMRERLLNRMQKGGVSQGFGLPMKPGTPIWVPDNGSHIIDVMTYIAGPNDPMTPEGEETFVLELSVHQGVGMSQGMRICLQETYGRKCPICEDRARRQREGDSEEIIKALTPSRYPRTLYDVIVGDSKALINEGHKIFHTSYWLLGMQLEEMAKRVMRPGDSKLDPYILYADPRDGKSIAFKKQGEGTSTKFVGVRFEDRDYEYDDSEIERAISVDSIIIVPTYDDLAKWYYGDSGEEDAGSFRGTGAAVRTTRETDDGGGSRRPRQESREPERQEEAKGPKGPSCPAGHVFGADVDKFQRDCRNCAEWEVCAATAEQMTKGERQADPPPKEDPPAREPEEGQRRRRSAEASELPPAREPEGDGSRRRRSAEEPPETTKQPEEGQPRRRRRE